jgi:hypothetical protein
LESLLAKPRRPWRLNTHLLGSFGELLALVEAEANYPALTLRQQLDLDAQQGAKVEITVARRLEKGPPVPERPQG